MKTMIALVCLCVVSVASGSAQTNVYVPDNVPTVGAHNGYPFHISNNWSFLYIIKASDLPSKPFRITDIAFATSLTTIWQSTGRFQIRMANTTVSAVNGSTCYDTVLGGAPTVVENLPAKTWKTTDNAWSPIGIECSHGYDGVSNLAIHLRYDGRTRTGVFVRYFTSNVSRAYERGATTVFNNPCATEGDNAGPKTRLTIDPSCVLLAPPQAKVGSAVPISLSGAPNGLYRIAASFNGSPPSFSIGPCRLCLALDGLFGASVTVGAPIFNGYTGPVVGGAASAKLSLPNNPAFVGFRIFHAGVVYDRSGIKGCSNTAGTEIIP